MFQFKELQTTLLTNFPRECRLAYKIRSRFPFIPMIRVKVPNAEKDNFIRQISGPLRRLAECQMRHIITLLGATILEHGRYLALEYKVSGFAKMIKKYIVSYLEKYHSRYEWSTAATEDLEKEDVGFDAAYAYLWTSEQTFAISTIVNFFSQHKFSHRDFFRLDCISIFLEPFPCHFKSIKSFHFVNDQKLFPYRPIGLVEVVEEEADTSGGDGEDHDEDEENNDPMVFYYELDF